ncbi:MAG: tRNA (adenosine(37)-N6)-threonylcarbamoyltransferase complex transferase subunit TsaD [Ignavibacteria bacterium]
MNIRNILAIETSCDETSASVLDGNKVLSNVISSQLFHTAYGGIVPELASRAHIEVIDKIVRSSLDESGINISGIDLVCATQGPGLIGSLLIGYNYAKSIALAGNKLFLGINHIESHLYSCFIGKENIDFPFIALIVSGGHTILFLVENYFKYRILGETQDDAAGEAFDKGAKMLGLGYPGGPEIENLSVNGNADFHEFPVSNVRDNIYGFSFSGIKTSLLYYLRKNFPDYKTEEGREKLPLNDISASYQKAIVKSLVDKTILASKNYGVKAIAVSGGVSSNSLLRKEFRAFEKSSYVIHFPEKKYSTDNAAMVGYTAYLKMLKGEHKYDSEKNLFENAFARFRYDI